MPSLLTLFLLQLDRIRGKPSLHATGPKKPSMSVQDLGKTKPNV